MTTRYSGLQVTLKQNMRDDDAEELIAAIRMLRHVVDVRPIIADLLSPDILRERVGLAQRLEKLACELLDGGVKVGDDK